MNEKIEQVARAICRQDMLDDGYSEEQSDRAAAGEMYRNFIKKAKAAIEAIKNPTEKMMDAFRSASSEEWNNAMDEALK